jgi:hypothetical protein
MVKVRLWLTLAGEPETPMVNPGMVVKVPVKVADGVNVLVGDGPKVAVLVGVGGVPVTVFGGVGVIVFVGPKFELFKIIGKRGLNSSGTITWAVEPTIGMRTTPITSKHARMIIDILAAAFKNETRPARIFFIYIIINLLDSRHTS